VAHYRSTRCSRLGTDAANARENESRSVQHGYLALYRGKRAGERTVIDCTVRWPAEFFQAALFFFFQRYPEAERLTDSPR